MKNLKLLMLLFGFCALITTQTTFAQDDSRAASEKAELNRIRNNEGGDLSNQFEKDLSVLVTKREKATGEERVAIQNQINELKTKYNKEVKGYANDEERIANIQKELAESTPLDEKYDISNSDNFILEAKQRLKSAKIRLVEDQENGSLSAEEVSHRRDKIMLIEKNLTRHEASLTEAKAKIAKRMEEIKELKE